MQGKSETVGGNFSTQNRISYFVHYNESTEMLCGFLKKFPVSDSDRTVMEVCRGLVVVSAIFNDHDKIRQPKGIGSKTLENVCLFMFIDEITLKRFYQQHLIPEKSENYKIGAWRVVKGLSKGLYENPAMNGVIPKYLVHRLFPNAKFIIWVDAKMQLMVDPLLLIHTLAVNENPDMAISKHPYYVHSFILWKKQWRR
ncbi:hypothetical protein RchiOBHm_Chr5g0014131 [Rosa chinensis]|uniref:TOD1/MUCI70 glycosyltransferase-like domain-containing protein n=1 Tax=Rosa chinensis TaxID=74649 RepID=A0A2P6Q5K4_ROSCH|nr:hypothetical protein RchiOBHm_Chr5g0014131 [Rosa chinensis]